jgi:hypothetical protein
MNRSFCEREDQTAAAVRAGTIDPEIASHARQCAACAEVALVTEFLRDGDTLAEHEQIPMPDAGLIWAKANLRATQEVVRMVLRPIRFMKIIAVIAFACSPWLRLVLPVVRQPSSSWSRALDFNVAFAPKLWPVMANDSTILLASTSTLVLLGLSSWYMLRQE